MGSKNFKRSKSKCKKFRKLKSIKREKASSPEPCNESNNEKCMKEKNISDDRLSPKNSSRSCTDEKDVTSVKYFSKVREDYFKYLQTVVSDNCVFCDSVVTDEILERLALELEQNAILACLQVDIYKRWMLRIIRDIKKCTKEKKIHQDVRKLLPEEIHAIDGSAKKTPITVNCTPSFPLVETYNRIPTISSVRTDENSFENTNVWMEQSNYTSDQYYEVLEQDHTIENCVNTNSHQWDKNEYCVIPNQSSYWGNEMLQGNDSNINIFENSECAIPNSTPLLQDNFNDLNKIDNTLHNQSEKKLDPLLVARSQLQKIVEQTLNETEKINKQKRDEQEKAYIAQILEGEDSLDDRFNDSLSDNENESKENVEESNLMDRLEKMRELFGVEEEESQSEIVHEKQKSTSRIYQVNSRSRRPTIWKYEKFIQLHKYSLIAAEMTFESRELNRRLFLELFGEDSDEEHELEYSSTEKFRSSCTERISSWVVKYLMPFYHEKRILGRNVFKSLGHYVSDTIVDKIQYPDEWTVKYLVSKFFPPKKKYICEADILSFQLE